MISQDSVKLQDLLRCEVFRQGGKIIGVILFIGVSLFHIFYKRLPLVPSSVALNISVNFQLVGSYM